VKSAGRSWATADNSVTSAIAPMSQLLDLITT
jgi:hypothetical protein